MLDQQHKKKRHMKWQGVREVLSKGILEDKHAQAMLSAW